MFINIALQSVVILRRLFKKLSVLKLVYDVQSQKHEQITSDNKIIIRDLCHCQHMCATYAKGNISAKENGSAIQQKLFQLQ